MSSSSQQNPNRYVNDLNRLKAQRSESKDFFARLFPFFIAIIFLVIVGVYGSLSLKVADENLIMLVAAIIGGYMALNIGANDVANNMGPAVGGRVLTVLTAFLSRHMRECWSDISWRRCCQDRCQGYHSTRRRLTLGDFS